MKIVILITALVSLLLTAAAVDAELGPVQDYYNFGDSGLGQLGYRWSSFETFTLGAYRQSFEDGGVHILQRGSETPVLAIRSF